MPLRDCLGYHIGFEHTSLPYCGRVSGTRVRLTTSTMRLTMGYSVRTVKPFFHLLFPSAVPQLMAEFWIVQAETKRLAMQIPAFYTYGQQGTAFINRGNVLRNNTFRRVRQEDKSVLCKLGDSSIEIADSSIENEGHSVET